MSALVQRTVEQRADRFNRAAKRAARKHICMKCWDPYYRRNLSEVWYPQRIGSITVFVKYIVRTCLKCGKFDQPWLWRAK